MRARTHKRHLGYFTSFIKKANVSKHLRAQNASGLARTAPRRVRALRMRAGAHERHLRAQHASGVARTQPQRIETLRMRAGSHGRHLQGERPQTEAPRMRAGTHKRHIGYFTSFIKKANVSKHLCFISKNLRQQKAAFGNYCFVEAKPPLFMRMSVSSRGNEGATVQGAQQ